MNTPTKGWKQTDPDERAVCSPTATAKLLSAHKPSKKALKRQRRAHHKALQDMEHANATFASAERIELVSDMRHEMDMMGDCSGMTEICQGGPYCTQAKSFLKQKDASEDNLPNCPWCVKVHHGDQRTTLQVMLQAIAARTTRRH